MEHEPTITLSLEKKAIVCDCTCGWRHMALTRKALKNAFLKHLDKVGVGGVYPAI